MTKDEILEKSRAENRNKDLVDLEVKNKGQRLGGIMGVLVAALLLSIEQLLNLGINYGYFLIILSADLAIFIYRSIKLRQKSDMVIALPFGAMFVYSLIMYIGSLPK